MAEGIILASAWSYPIGGVVRKGHWEESAFYSLLVGHHLFGSRQRIL